MFIIAPQGRFWSFTSPQYYFGLLPYCTNDSEWTRMFPYSGTEAWWIGFWVFPKSENAYKIYLFKQWPADEESEPEQNHTWNIFNN